ncbi:hypothetical protein C1H46_008761 [Malus baccata]|uniref:HTH La-type RNA-binding domain-containing protein n=1 Tax=Malus baccata TaxID=106549 RepID=A0A540N3J9_MALBA|nr:hypothetical protein C1H46_008761 [Malus baccata]
MVQPYIPASGHAYQPYAGPIPSVGNHMVKSGFETPVQNFVQPVQPQPRSNPNAYGVNFSTRRPNMQEPGRPWNHTWHQQRAFNPRENIPVQQGVGPFLRPQFFGPAPGFMVGPSIPGPAPICYLPVPPLSAIRGPHPPSFVPHPLNPGAPLPPSKTHTLSLRDNIIKQIECYFSDENLKKDRYLISLMDDQGWVPITTIADFKRVCFGIIVDIAEAKVKKMCTDIAFIIDSLLGSTTVEVQSDFSYHSEGIETVRYADDGTEGMPSYMDMKNPAMSNDFANTFMLDEELELEQKIIKDDRSPIRSVGPRIDDEDDEILVNDQDVQRLVIVTQNSRVGKGSKHDDKESKTISNELASAINDGLYFYEQSVGFFFSSTPPETHGPRSSKVSVSPHGFLSGSSPPVGSVPKSFPPFQHPSHQLLEENGFKQQK